MSADLGVIDVVVLSGELQVESECRATCSRATAGCLGDRSNTKGGEQLDDCKNRQAY